VVRSYGAVLPAFVLVRRARAGFVAFVLVRRVGAGSSRSCWFVVFVLVRDVRAGSVLYRAVPRVSLVEGT